MHKRRSVIILGGNAGRHFVIKSVFNIPLSYNAYNSHKHQPNLMVHIQNRPN